MQDLKSVEYAEDRGFLSSTEEIIEDLRNGRMIILVDAEDRENEGDLVVAGQMATPDAINFMATHGRGLICLTLSAARAGDLHLQYMTRHNEERQQTAFTVSIEAREGVTTGISAADRSRTISTAIDASKSHKDIVSPGHVFPLIAREGGVLVRAGHTEATVDLARLAGLNPSAVICEIMNEDGTMARMPDLVAFAQLHGLKIGTIEDIIAYRLRNDSIVRAVSKTSVTSSFGGNFDLHVYETTVETEEHMALVKGDLSAPGPVLVRVHAVDPMSDLIGVGRGGSSSSGSGSGGSAGGSQIEKAMRAVAAEGRGVVVLIRDLQPKSVSGWITRSSTGGKPAETSSAAGGHERRLLEIGVGSQILLDLGVREMELLTNSPSSIYVGLEGYGLKIVGQRRID